jgi:hypothetical protein
MRTELLISKDVEGLYMVQPKIRLELEHATLDTGYTSSGKIFEPQKLRTRGSAGCSVSKFLK